LSNGRGRARSAGSDWETIKLMRVDSAGAVTQLPDTLNDVKFSSTGWTPDDKARTCRALTGQACACAPQCARARARLLFMRATGRCARRRAAAAIAVARHAACATERMRRRGAGAAWGGRAPGKAPGRFTPVLKMPLALPYQPYTYAPRAGLLLQPLHARRQRDRAGHGRQQEPAAVVPPGGRAAERGCVRAGAARPAGLVAGRGRHRRPAVRAPRCMHDVGCGLGRASLHIQLWRTRAW